MDYENILYENGSLEKKIENFVAEIKRISQRMEASETSYLYMTILQELFEITEQELYEVEEERRNYYDRIIPRGV